MVILLKVALGRDCARPGRGLGSGICACGVRRYSERQRIPLVTDTPDLVVLDLNMAVIDGWEFRAQQLRLENGRLAAIPVLLVTGTDGADGHAATLKPVGLIKKPFGPEHLLDAIGTALRR